MSHAKDEASRELICQYYTKLKMWPSFLWYESWVVVVTNSPLGDLATFP